MTDLNTLYSPSAWVIRCSPSQVVAEHENFGKKCNFKTPWQCVGENINQKMLQDSDLARNRVLHKTVRYSEGHETFLDIFYEKPDSIKFDGGL